MHDDDYPRYDSEYTQYYHEVACGNSWAREESQDCGCGGRGWWLSQEEKEMTTKKTKKEE